MLTHTQTTRWVKDTQLHGRALSSASLVPACRFKSLIFQLAVIVLLNICSRSRTGTKTFAQALETLIGPVHDGGAQGLVGTAEQRDQWLQFMRLVTKEDSEKSLAEKKKQQWLLAELMEGYSAAVDAPCIWLVPELLELYPDAVGKESTPRIRHQGQLHFRG